VATASEHIARGRRNEEVAASLPRGCADWRITVTFYAAVHYVESVIAGHGMRSSDHRSRQSYINAIRELRPVAIDYQTLANQAWIARYRADYDFNDASVQGEVTKTCALLGKIKTGLGI
jgi:hypothetical protein